MKKLLLSFGYIIERWVFTYLVRNKLILGCYDAPKPPDYPEPIDYGESAIGFLEMFLDPKFQKTYLAAERGQREQQRMLGLQDLQATVFGQEGLPGTIDILEQITPRVSTIQREALTQQRAADIADVEALGGRAIEAMRSSDPEMQKLLRNLGSMADTSFARAGQITPQQRRQAEQQARAAYSARGRGTGEASVAAEILGREDMLRANRAEARQAAGQYFSMLQATGADPFQAILGRPGTAYAGATQQQAFGQQTALQNLQSMGIDPMAGINMAAQERANQASYQSSVYGAQTAADAAGYSAMMGLAGSALGALGTYSGLKAAGAASAGGCWIARECFGEEDERWMLFRAWLMTKAPEWFYNWYMKHGESVAAWLRNKPVLKSIIRFWMNGRIKTVMEGFNNGNRQYA